MTQYTGPNSSSVCFAGRMYQVAGQTHNSGSATFDVLLFDTVDFDTTDGFMDITNDRVLALQPGLYRIRVHCEFAANTTGNRREIGLYRNGSTQVSNDSFQNTVNVALGLFCQWTGFMDSGEYMDAQAFQNSGANLALNTGSHLQWMDAVYLGS